MAAKFLKSCGSNIEITKLSEIPIPVLHCLPTCFTCASSWYLLLIQAQRWELTTLTDFQESRAWATCRLSLSILELPFHVRATYSATFLENEHLFTKGSNHFIAYPLKKKAFIYILFFMCMYIRKNQSPPAVISTSQCFYIKSLYPYINRNYCK